MRVYPIVYYREYAQASRMAGHIRWRAHPVGSTPDPLHIDQEQVNGA